MNPIPLIARTIGASPVSGSSTLKLTAAARTPAAVGRQAMAIEHVWPAGMLKLLPVINVWESSVTVETKSPAASPLAAKFVIFKG